MERKLFIDNDEIKSDQTIIVPRTINSLVFKMMNDNGQNEAYGLNVRLSGDLLHLY